MKGVEEMITLLREVRALVPDDASLVAEIDGYLDQLQYAPVRKAVMGGMFLPTGHLQEALGEPFLALADRFDAIEMALDETWACRICAAGAGRIELRESGELKRTSFTGVLTQKLTEVGPTWDAVNTSAPAIHALDPELTPFWCPECRSVYCGEHWTHWDVFDDDGHHDSIRGRCPEGHERMLED